MAAQGPVNKEYLRESLTRIFGSCPLSDDFIDGVDSQCYYCVNTIVECQRYMRDVLGMPYSEEYVKTMNEQGLDPYQKVDMNFRGIEVEECTHLYKPTGTHTMECIWCEDIIDHSRPTIDSDETPMGGPTGGL